MHGTIPFVSISVKSVLKLRHLKRIGRFQSDGCEAASRAKCQGGTFRRRPGPRQVPSGRMNEGSANDIELNPPIAELTLLGIIRGNRCCLAVSLCSQNGGVNSLPNQIVANRICSLLRELEI